MTSRLAPATLAAIAALALLGGCAGLVSKSEPSVQRLVAEDDQVRIDELRVRGQTLRLAVQPKIAGAPGYEILPIPSGQSPAASRDGAGQRVWPVLSF